MPRLKDSVTLASLVMVLPLVATGCFNKSDSAPSASESKASKCSAANIGNLPLPAECLSSSAPAATTLTPAPVATPTPVVLPRSVPIPPSPTLINPHFNPFASGDTTLAINGTCVPGSKVELSEEDIEPVTCEDSGLFSFKVSRDADGTYDFSVRQSVASSQSSPLNFQWIRDTTIPPAPVITEPGEGKILSRANDLVIRGSCVNQNTVRLSGNSEQSAVCADGAFEFTIAQSEDGDYSFALAQTSHVNGLASSGVSLQWTRDTTPPAAPSLTSLPSNPYASGDTEIALAGACEPDALVTLAGDAEQSVRCGSAGTYSFSLNKNADATYAFQLSQTDNADNSSAPLSVQWKRVTTIPAGPRLTQPATAVAITNSASLSITGECETGNEIQLSGDESQAVPCANGTFSFTASQPLDGIYSLAFVQLNPINGFASSPTLLQWIRDTVSPPAPVITVPGESPFTSAANLRLQGSCEPGSSVLLGGADAQSMTCTAEGGFDFTVSKTTDGTYELTVKQADAAGNLSPASSLEWSRLTSTPVSPVILTPVASPAQSHASSFSLSGACTTGMTVLLDGDVTAEEVSEPAAALQQACEGGAFQFLVNKAADGSYALSLRQRNKSGIDSPAVTQIWVRDSVAPVVTLGSSPLSPNRSPSATFDFTANEPDVTFECRLDGGAWVACASPAVHSNLPAGSHSFEVRAMDIAGNIGSFGPYPWQQGTLKTIALYHFESPVPLNDSSSQSGSSLNHLTNGGAKVAAGQFGSGFAFAGAERMSAPSSPSLAEIGSQLTVEAWVNFSAFPTKNKNMVLVSKSGSAGQGWELRLRNHNNTLKVSFLGSLDGVVVSEILSSVRNLVTGRFYHFAVTFNAGDVRLYVDGQQVGSGTIGASGSSSLFNSSSPLVLGQSESGLDSLNGILDELRISQIARYNGPFSVPIAPFTGD